MLINANVATRTELEDYYDMDEALKLFALWRMREDISAVEMDKLKDKAKR